MIRSEGKHISSLSETALPTPTAKMLRSRGLYLLSLILVIEIVLQGYYRITTGSYLYNRDKPPIWSADPISGWTNRPNFSYRHLTPEFATDLHTNSQGFRVSKRHEEYPHHKASGKYRILLLGPSFPFGWGVDYEETFGVQLARVLKGKGFVPGQSIEVLNHGVPALPAANQLEWFRHTGKDYSPDLVIHFAYGSLEVNPQPDRSVIVRNGRLQPLDVNFTDIIWGHAKNSATVFFGGIIVAQLSKMVGVDKGDGGIEGAGQVLHNASVFHAQSITVRESTAFYRAFKRAANEAGAEFLVVHFPLAYVVHSADRARWALHGVENIETQVAFNRKFAIHLNQKGVHCLNLTDALVEYAKQNPLRLYYWLDVHWTPLGNRRSAELVSQYLEIKP